MQNRSLLDSAGGPRYWMRYFKDVKQFGTKENRPDQ